MTFGRGRGWIGIDFGPRALKVAQLKRNGGGPSLAAAVVMPRIRPADWRPAAERAGCEWTGSDLAAALQLGGGFSGRTAACVLPMHLAELHALQLPPAENAERRAMVASELSAIAVGDGQDRSFDFWETLPAASAGPPGTVAVNVLSAPRGAVSRVAEHVAGARLSCEVVDGMPWVLARAVALAYGRGPGAPIGALDWDVASATFTVVSDGRPLYTRHLRSCGAGLLVEAVGQALGLSEEESFRVLAVHGLPDPDGAAPEGAEISEIVAEVTAPALREFIAELKKTIFYLHTQYPGVTLARLCLTGDGAAVRNGPAFLASKIGLPVETWRLPGAATSCDSGTEGHPALLATAAALSALAWTT